MIWTETESPQRKYQSNEIRNHQRMRLLTLTVRRESAVTLCVLCAVAHRPSLPTGYSADSEEYGTVKDVLQLVTGRCLLVEK